MMKTNDAPLLSVDRRGNSVLAKRTKYGINAMTFANKTQANNAAAAVNAGTSGFKADVLAGWPFLVAVTAKVYGGAVTVGNS